MYRLACDSSAPDKSGCSSGERTMWCEYFSIWRQCVDFARLIQAMDAGRARSGKPHLMQTTEWRPKTYLV